MMIGPLCRIGGTRVCKQNVKGVILDLIHSKVGDPPHFASCHLQMHPAFWLIVPTAFTSRDLELIGVPPLLSWDVGRAFLAVVLSMLSWKEPTGSFKLSVRNSAS